MTLEKLSRETLGEPSLLIKPLVSKDCGREQKSASDGVLSYTSISHLDKGIGNMLITFGGDTPRLFDLG